MLQFRECREHEEAGSASAPPGAPGLPLQPPCSPVQLRSRFPSQLSCTLGDGFAPILPPAVCFSQLFKINFSFVSSFRILGPFIAADVIFIITFFKDCCQPSPGFLSLLAFAFVLQNFFVSLPILREWPSLPHPSLLHFLPSLFILQTPSQSEMPTLVLPQRE